MRFEGDYFPQPPLLDMFLLASTDRLRVETSHVDRPKNSLNFSSFFECSLCLWMGTRAGEERRFTLEAIAEIFRERDDFVGEEEEEVESVLSDEAADAACCSDNCACFTSCSSLLTDS